MGTGMRRRVGGKDCSCSPPPRGPPPASSLLLLSSVLNPSTHLGALLSQAGLGLDWSQMAPSSFDDGLLCLQAVEGSEVAVPSVHLFVSNKAQS